MDFSFLLQGMNLNVWYFILFFDKGKFEPFAKKKKEIITQSLTVFN